MAQTLYDILELPRYASLREVKSAFKKLAVRYHPDKNPGNPKAEERFKIISNAYQILGNEDTKQEYDLRLSGYIQYVKKQNESDEDKEKERRRKVREILKRKKELERRRIIEEYEKLQEGTPLWLRRAFNYAIIFFGARLIFSNWIYTIDTFSPISFVIAVVIILYGGIREQKLNYTIGLYRQLKGKIKYNLQFRSVRNLLLTLVISFSLAVAVAKSVELYHFAYYSEEVFADVSIEMTQGPYPGYRHVYTYIVEGEEYRQVIAGEDLDLIDKNGQILIRYSYVNPKYSRIVEDVPTD